MQLLGWLILAALVLVALFSAVNWALLAAPGTSDLVVVAIPVAPGLVLLAATLVIAALFGIYVVSLRTALLVETRRQMKALESQRDLADKAEGSRFTALASQIEQE